MNYDGCVKKDEHQRRYTIWPFVNAQELLEVATKLPVKLNDPVIDVGI
jgi:hypothetical protein